MGFNLFESVRIPCWTEDIASSVCFLIEEITLQECKLKLTPSHPFLFAVWLYVRQLLKFKKEIDILQLQGINCIFVFFCCFGWYPERAPGKLSNATED